MKKNLLLVLALASLFLLTGCDILNIGGNTKTLVCSKDSIIKDIKINTEVEMVMKGDILDRVIITAAESVTKETSEENFINMVNYTEKYFGELDKEEGMEAKFVSTDTKHTATLTIDYNKIDEAELIRKQIDFDDRNRSLEDAKNDYEGDGYTCEIK